MIQPSVSLIGSFRRYYAEVRKAAEVFRAAGIVVNSPPMSRIIDLDREFVRFESDPPQASDGELQDATLEKIFSSDFVYVVNPKGYIGLHTAYELGRIHERGIAVYYAEPPGTHYHVPDGTVIGAQDLAVGLTAGDMKATPIRRPRVAALPTADIVIFTIRAAALRAADQARYAAISRKAGAPGRIHPPRRVLGGHGDARASRGNRHAWSSYPATAVQHLFRA